MANVDLHHFSPDTRACPRRDSAFTLVELLVVIGIIAVLISILLPAGVRARKQAQTVACASNLKQVGAMLQMYAQDYRGWLPQGNLMWAELHDSGLLKNMYQYMDNTYPEGVGHNNNTEKLILRCPSLRRNARAWGPIPGNPRNWNYTINTRTFGNGGWFPYRRKLGTIKDATKRAWVADAPPSDPCWETYDNGNMMISYDRHRNGSNVLYVDTHVGFVNPYKDLDWPDLSPFVTDLVFYGQNTN